MSLQGLYAVLGLFGLTAEIGLFIVLFARRQYKSFPVFTIYIGFNILYDLGVGVLATAHSNHLGLVLALGLLPLQYLLELGVLLEIAWNVLRPVHVSLPTGSVRVFVGAVSLALICGTLLAWHLGNSGNKLQDLKGLLDLTIGLLRMVVFAAIAGFAQLLGIGWKDRVLQLATALTFYSAADLIISLVEHYSGGSSNLEAIRGLAYVMEVGFLLWAFTTKEVERREFSPQMEQFLVTLAGRAKHARTVLVRLQVK